MPYSAPKNYTFVQPKKEATTFPLAAVKVVDSIAVLTEDTKARAGVVVLVRVPEDVDGVESLAGDRAPVGLRILDGGDCWAGIGAGDGPTWRCSVSMVMMRVVREEGISYQSR